MKNGMAFGIIEMSIRSGRPIGRGDCAHKEVEYERFVSTERLSRGVQIGSQQDALQKIIEPEAEAEDPLVNSKNDDANRPGGGLGCSPKAPYLYIRSER